MLAQKSQHLNEFFHGDDRRNFALQQPLHVVEAWDLHLENALALIVQHGLHPRDRRNVEVGKRDLFQALVKEVRHELADLSLALDDHVKDADFVPQLLVLLLERGELRR